MRLDHFVVHIPNSPQLLNDLKATIEPMGFPFEPTRGKGAKGFKVSNIWIGQEYFEIVRLLDPDHNEWESRWVKRFDHAHGVFFVFSSKHKSWTCLSTNCKNAA